MDETGRMESVFTSEDLSKSLGKEAINCLKWVQLITGV